MQFEQVDLNHISGSEFSNSYMFKLKNNPLYSRLEMICRICRGKRVLHIGCCDHLPLIDRKIKENIWLHKLLDEECSYVVGVDINEKAVDYVNDNALSKNQVIFADITKAEFLSMLPCNINNFDYVIMGEIVEHIDNPVNWLSTVKKNLANGGYKGYYLITVPNAFSLLNDGIAKKGIERINSDHKYWFTPYTISKILYDAGIMPEQLFFARGGIGANGGNPITRRFFAYLEMIRRKPSSINSYRGDSIIMCGK